MRFKYKLKEKSPFEIEDLSFKIVENSIYALTGNNGAGKTTLLRLLVGLLKLDSGEIKIFGKTLTRNKEGLWKIRQQIGFLFQNPDDQLFAPTIEEDVGFAARNLKLSDSEVRERVEWALNAVNLFEFKNKSPFNLSWGQKKRAALAGLLVMKPKLLILDEPFANLDFKSICNHLKIIEELRTTEKMTILFTSHNLFFVEKWADKMLVLNNGHLLFEGLPEQGLKNSEVHALLGSYDEINDLIKKTRI
ncbi:MAG: energy-coupling factor ABC transporter ATP-binding protein [Candidatus Lokiarchaeota archaeon]|nr:energy-coupling factor ABC transporter ATP-binding protein [Candidatus Lokiarchaeota archaeon]